jgi:hypothetical protein
MKRSTIRRLRKQREADRDELSQLARRLILDGHHTEGMMVGEVLVLLQKGDKLIQRRPKTPQEHASLDSELLAIADKQDRLMEAICALRDREDDELTAQ